LIDVADMRRRIAEENPRPSPWDLKNRRGGLIDLEFIVQHLMLREAASSPQILRRNTALALSALGEAGMLPARAQHELGEAATLLGGVQAVLTLISDGLPAAAALPEPDAATLAHCLGAVDFARLDADITNATARVRSWYDRLIAEPARRAAEEIGDSAQ
jgi:glutamate-ammonia-ligase adenylyltransferase